MHILDRPLVVNEIWYCLKKSKQKVLLFKFSFDKAFDSINWEFLDSNLMLMRFRLKRRKQIKGCLHSSPESVLVNGNPTKEFNTSNGFQQWDPLSTFLCIATMEGLSVAMRVACDAGVFQGFQLLNRGPLVSQLLYVDDALFVGE